MTRQRQILVTVTYNDLGCIIDTKTEPYEEPNLQPTCNNLATDTISRQAAIDAMTNTLWHYPNECYRNLNEYEFAKGLAELGLKSVPSTQPEPQWIPVSERLPEMKKPILATYKTEDGLKVDRTMYDRYGFLIGEVTAWMPLPEPYGGEADG